MNAVHKKESLGPVLPPTPATTPPCLAELQSVTTTRTTTTEVTTTSMTSRRTYTEAERQAHIFLARQCAEQLRALHLANGAQMSEKHEHGTRYHVEMKRLEGDKVVSKRVAVIIPPAQREHFRQHQLPALTLVPPPHLGTPPKVLSLHPQAHPSSSASRTRTTPSRRQSLPSLRSLSLLPTSSPPKPATFRSRTVAPLPSRSIPSTTTAFPTPNPSPSKHHPNPPPSLSRPQIPSTINLDTTSSLLQRRKLALAKHYKRSSPPSHNRQVSLPPTPPKTVTTTSSSPGEAGAMKRKRSVTENDEKEDGDENETNRSKCARWSRHVRQSTKEGSIVERDEMMGTEGNDREMSPSIGERVKREREVSLGERRGKKLRSLDLL
ncbi:hypothetical protein JCM16303_007196 [Sporobolomyces ruberrimus]